MKKIKVLWIYTGGLRRNGICVSQLDYYKKMNQNRFQIDVLAVHNNTTEMINAYQNAGCKVYQLSDRKKHLIRYRKELKKLIEQEEYDIVHVHGSSTLLFIELEIAKKCGVKVRIAHSRNTTCDRVWLEKIFRKRFDQSYNTALACGEEAGKWLYQGKEFIVFHNGKDLEKYKFNSEVRHEMRSQLKLNNEIAIGHVGLFNDQKNHSFLIDVFERIHKEHNNTRLYLMGTGPKLEEVKEKVNRLGIQDAVIFTGSISNVHEYLQAMDVMLFPSLFEGLPNVVIEWQAAGLPSIISDTITKECKVSDLVSFLPIHQGIQCWTEKFECIPVKTNEDRLASSNNACNLLVKNGFELSSNTKKLEEIYINALKEYKD